MVGIMTDMIPFASRVSRYLGGVSFRFILGGLVMFGAIPLLLSAVHIVFLALPRLPVRWLTNAISPRVLVASGGTTWVAWPRLDDTIGIGN